MIAVALKPNEVNCPVCGAPVGKRCDMGKRAGRYHSFRVREATAASSIGALVRLGGSDREVLAAIARTAVALAEKHGAHIEETSQMLRLINNVVKEGS